MNSIRIAVVGIGNCASSLVQGLEHYREGTNDSVGLMHWEMGGYKPSDIKVVAAWDVDRRKVGKDVAEAIFVACFAGNPRIFWWFEIVALTVVAILGLVWHRRVERSFVQSTARPKSASRMHLS